MTPQSVSGERNATFAQTRVDLEAFQTVNAPSRAQSIPDLLERLAALEAECDDLHVLLDSLGIIRDNFSLIERIGFLVGLMTPKYEITILSGNTSQPIAINGNIAALEAENAGLLDELTAVKTQRTEAQVLAKRRMESRRRAVAAWRARRAEDHWTEQELVALIKGYTAALQSSPPFKSAPAPEGIYVTPQALLAERHDSRENER